MFILYSLALLWAPPPSLQSDNNAKESFSSYLYTDPKHERTKYFNDILPDMYKHAHPYLLEKFSTYLYKEREERFQTMKLLEMVSHNLDVLFSQENSASCFKFLDLDGTVLRHKHLDTVSAGLSKLEGLRLKLQHEENKLKSNIEKLFCKNKLKEWATEQYKYSQSKLEEVKNLLANVNIKYENLLIAKDRLCQVFKGIPKNQKSKGE